jgi:hypothetical protein
MILLGVSCSTDEKKEVIDDILIFGYSGFCYKDSVNKRYYSDEIFHNDSVNLEIDSAQLDIRQYFEFKKDSSINVAFRKPRQSIECLTLNSFDTVGFEKLINKCLINKDYSNNYCYHDTISGIYDGWYYTMVFKTSKNNSIQINYIPDCLPDSLKVLHDFIEKVFTENDFKSKICPGFNPITSIEARRLFRYHPPPKYDKTKRIKFE